MVALMDQLDGHPREWALVGVEQVIQVGVVVDDPLEEPRRQKLTGFQDLDRAERSPERRAPPGSAIGAVEEARETRLACVLIGGMLLG